MINKVSIILYMAEILKSNIMVHIFIDPKNNSQQSLVVIPPNKHLIWITKGYSLLMNV